MRLMRPLAVSLLACFALSGCGIAVPLVRSDSGLSQISLGDSREFVTFKLGQPSSIRGARKTDDGKTLQLDEYLLYGPSAPLTNFLLGPLTLSWTWFVPLGGSFYWLQYVDNKLTKWNRAGDWQPDTVLDITTHTK